MRRLIILMTLVMSVMLFTSNPTEGSQRVLEALWNTGHLFFFAMLTWILLSQQRLKQLSGFRLLVISLLFSFFLGGLIELLQFKIGRSMDAQDLYTDVLGGLLGYCITLLTHAQCRRLKHRLFIFIASLAILLLGFWPVYQVLHEDAMIAADIPVIASFETQPTLSRWSLQSVNLFELDDNIKSAGHSSVKIQYEVAQYPSISLDVLYPDWLQYKYLNLSLYNDQDKELSINLKVFDRPHRRRGYRYNDRFNREFMLQPGWNRLQIRLLDIYNAPAKRSMEMQQIASLSLFLINPKKPMSVHLDNIHLSK